MIYAFRDMVPVVDPSAYVHPQATLIGHVTVGPDCYVGPGAVLRGDWGKIVLERGCNVQECCVLHMFPGATVLLEEGAHIGHGAMVHGARVGRNSLVGMNAVLLDDVELGEECIVGALALVKAGTHWPRRSLVIGNPAERKGEVNDQMIAHKTEGTALYQGLPADAHAHLTEVEALTSVPADRVEDFPTYDTWAERKQQGGSSEHELE
ncbi:MAG: transferase hexapeptide repeat family protein [Flavobacteriales bacterium]